MTPPCAVNPELFFPARGAAAQAAEAKALCAGCPMKAKCLELGLEEEHGIWGGTSETERQLLRQGGAARRRRERDDKIALLRRKGWTQAQIADALGMKRTTVAMALKRQAA